MGEKVQKFQVDFYKFLHLLGFKGSVRARTGGLRVRVQGSGSTSHEPSIGPGTPGTGREINPFLRVRYDRGCYESRTANATERATKSNKSENLGAFLAPHGSRLVARKGVQGGPQGPQTRHKRGKRRRKPSRPRRRPSVLSGRRTCARTTGEVDAKSARATRHVGD